MATPLAAFIEFIFKVFILVLNLTVDGICLIFLLLALAQPWRLPKVIRGAAINHDWFNSRDNYRGTCLSQFFFGIADAVTGIVFVVVICSGLRTGNLCRKVCEDSARTRNYTETQFASKWAAKTWSQFGHLLLDVVPFPFLVGYLAMPWRWPALLRGLRRHGASWLFRTLCPCVARGSRDEPSDAKTRSRWMGQFFIGLLDAVTFIPYVIVLCTGLRARKLCEKIEKVAGKYEEQVEFNYDRVSAIWLQFGSLLVDVVFVPIFLIVFLSGWRTSALLEVMADPKQKGMKKRCNAIKEFAKMLVDVPYILMSGLVVVFAPWRWGVLFGKLRLGDSTYAKTACAGERRKAAYEQLGLVFVDYIAACCAAVVLLAPWRSRKLLRTLNLRRKKPAANERFATDADDRHEAALSSLVSWCSTCLAS